MVDLSSATPLPWVTFEGGSSATDAVIYGICEEGKSIGAILGAETAVVLCSIGDGGGYYDDVKQVKDDFAFIVQAVNSFYVMLEALKAIAKHIPTSTAQDGGPNSKSSHVAAADMVRKAIAIAEGRAQ